MGASEVVCRAAHSCIVIAHHFSDGGLCCRTMAVDQGVRDELQDCKALVRAAVCLKRCTTAPAECPHDRLCQSAVSQGLLRATVAGCGKHAGVKPFGVGG